MNEKLAKAKEFLLKTKDKIIEISIKIYTILKQNPIVTALVGFTLVSFIIGLIATLALKEYIVSVCILIVLEVFMAAFLHKAEIWKHGILLVAQIVAAVIIKRIPLVVLMIVAYIAATFALGLISTAKESKEATTKTEETEPKKRQLKKKGPKA